MFSSQFFAEFSLKQCPILIGIMPLFGQQTDAGIVIEYQFQTILRGDTLTQNTTETNLKNFINELKAFKAASDQNVKNLVGIVFFVSYSFDMTWICFLVI